ncbi:hypothetical protein [Edaphobacter sp. 12200R-103]|jgi:hypothetical protein|uniref:hypothetical protein n=1 Tax=Edaphobacter sp. 12200R-103 TaxID=2703788 RepID=UPI00138BA6BC|nr:hypothetical protein [Edaphobacter sp. 12200R-103]QHS52527.1 hypothetical protein GWR55_12920 [Edaphobacter sp. 12200R-103]
MKEREWVALSEVEWNLSSTFKEVPFAEHHTARPSKRGVISTGDAQREVENPPHSGMLVGMIALLETP